MKIDFNPIQTGFASEVKQNKSNGDFKNVISEFVNQVNDSEKKAAEVSKGFILGDDVSIHEVMIAGEKAKTDLQLLIEIRNKAVDTYNELTKMQI